MKFLLFTLFLYKFRFSLHSFCPIRLPSLSCAVSQIDYSKLLIISRCKHHYFCRSLIYNHLIHFVLLHSSPFEPMASQREESAMPVVTAGTATTVHTPDEQSSFPFMELPVELRIMVYNYHFFQPVEHPREGCDAIPHGDWDLCAPGGPACLHGITNGNVNLGNLWAASKTIYHEAMPIYFSRHHFQFPTLERLGKFLITISYYQRQYITKLSFVYRWKRSVPNFHVQESLRLLLQCPNLIELGIGVCSFEHVRGLKHLLQLRGIKKLEVKCRPLLRSEPMRDHRVCRGLRNGVPRRVLTEPYTPAAMKCREAKGDHQGHSIEDKIRKE